MTGRTVVVTGATSGVGLAAARALGGAGARVVLAVRDPDKGAGAASSVPGEAPVRPLDLSDLASVRRFAGAWRLVRVRGGAQLVTRSKRAADAALAARPWRASEERARASFL